MATMAWTHSIGWIPDAKTLEVMREDYKPGTRVELVRMDDPMAPKPGTRGTVTFVDDAGDVHCNWDNGSSLALIYNHDSFRIVEDE